MPGYKGHLTGGLIFWGLCLASLLGLPIIILPMMFYKLPLLDSLPFYLAAILGYLSHLVLERKF